jgi:peptidoglycan/xylan/chitin deacetylase (PgdA/CDA1 family)
MTTASQPQVDVALTFDFDTFSTWIGTFGATSPSMLSRGEFGPIGARRLLALLDEFRAPATFFTPGHTAVAYPGVMEKIVEAGHEVAHHGWVHENPVTLSRDEEIRVLERGIEALEKTTGQTPKGYRSPAWDNSPNTVSLLLDYDFEYESSLMGNDFEPYWCRVGDRWSTTEPYEFGTPTSLVELPVAWHLDDWPQFEFVARPGDTYQGLRAPSTVYEIWKGEFDYLYHHVGRGVLTITMHPQVIGRGHRLLMLRSFMEYMASLPGVTFTRAIDYVTAWKQDKQPSLPEDVIDSSRTQT